MEEYCAQNPYSEICGYGGSGGMMTCPYTGVSVSRAEDCPEFSGGGGGDDTAPPQTPPPTPQENANSMATCVVDNLDSEDRAEATPHSVRIEARPRVGGRDVDGYAGCVRGSRYVTVVKKSVAERGGTALRQLMLMAHEIAHHIATDLATCHSHDGREHGSAFRTALVRAESAARGCI